MKGLQIENSCSEDQRNENPALIWADGSFSYAEYFHNIIQTAKILNSYEIEEGSRVAVLSDIDYRFPIVFFAILHLKAIVVLLNTRLPTEQTNQQIAQANCQWLITFDESVLPNGNADISILFFNELAAIIASE